MLANCPMRGSSFVCSWIAYTSPIIHKMRNAMYTKGASMIAINQRIVSTTFAAMAARKSTRLCFTWCFASLLFCIFSSTKYQMSPMGNIHASIAQIFSFSTFAMGVLNMRWYLKGVAVFL